MYSLLYFMFVYYLKTAMSINSQYAVQIQKANSVIS